MGGFTLPITKSREEALEALYKKSFMKHCTICNKVLDVNDAFTSSDPDLCGFCDMLVKKERQNDRLSTSSNSSQSIR